MTPEEKLFLIDLSSRVHYGVLVEQTWFPTYLADKVQCLKSVQNNNIVTLCWRFKDEAVPVYEIKPYLRPMSSMTEEEKKEYDELCDNCLERDSVDYNISTLDRTQLVFVIDWLYEHHFDFRGFIEKGLALEAPEGIYNIKK